MKKNKIIQSILQVFVLNIIPLIGLLFFDWDLDYFVIFAFISLCLSIVFEIVKIPFISKTEVDNAASVLLIVLGLPGLMVAFYFFKEIIDQERVSEIFYLLQNSSFSLLKINISLLVALLASLVFGYLIDIYQVYTNNETRSGFVNFSDARIAIAYRVLVIMLGIVVIFLGLNFWIACFIVIILLFPLIIFLQIILKIAVLLFLLYISKQYSSSMVFAILFLVFNIIMDSYKNIELVKHQD